MPHRHFVKISFVGVILIDGKRVDSKGQSSSRIVKGSLPVIQLPVDRWIDGRGKMRASNTFVVNSLAIRSRQVSIRLVRASPIAWRVWERWRRVSEVLSARRISQTKPISCRAGREPSTFLLVRVRRVTPPWNPAFSDSRLPFTPKWHGMRLRERHITEIVARAQIRDSVPYRTNKWNWPTKLKYCA